MIGSDALETVMGARAAGNKTDLVSFTRALSKLGMHIVLVEPNAKAPLDLRTVQLRNKDDRAAQEEAKAAGVVAWQKVKSRAGVHLATDNATRLAQYLKRADAMYGPDAVNLGIEVGRSRLLIVDFDTKAAKTRFFTEWSQADPEISPDMMPTVSTPGKLKDGVMVHAEGGHQYFTIPDGYELPEGGTGAYTVPGDVASAWTAYWADRQLLIPPSVRPEGPYRWNGGVRPIPAFLLAKIEEQTTLRKAKARDRIESGMSSNIDTWAATTAWATILEPDGWTRTGQIDSCGCETWTAPGPHDNPKSATAHDLGCSRDEYSGYAGHCPLHIWTDNPPDELAAYVAQNNTRTLSKIQYVAWTHYEGDINSACTSYGIPRHDEVNSVDEFLLVAGMEAAASAHVEGSEEWKRLEAQADAVFTEAVQNVQASETGTADTTEEESLTPFFDEHEVVLDDVRDLPPVPFLVDGWIDQGSLVFVAGEPGSGKSFVSLDLCASLVTGQSWQGNKTTKSRVGYIVGEGYTGFVRRVVAWEKTHDVPDFRGKESGFRMVKEPTVTSDTQLWAQMVTWILAKELDVVVFDTWARITPGVDENSATETSAVMRIFSTLQRLTGVTIVVVHHVARGSEHMRGSTALEGAAETILFVRGNGQGDIHVRVDKQKNHEQAEPLDLVLKTVDDSAVVASSDGEIHSTTDPFEILPPEPIGLEEQAEALVDTVRRLSPTMGITRAMFVIHTPTDRLSRDTLTDVAKQRVVIRALDYAVANKMVEGVENKDGSLSTTRFVPAS